MPPKAYLSYLILACLLCLSACNQAVIAQDTTYIQTFKDTMNFKFIVTHRNLSTSLRHKDQSERMKLAPNNLSYVGLGGYIWGIGFQLHQSMPIRWFFDQDIFRESQIFDFQGTLFKNRWMLDGAYQAYRNLNVSNPEDFPGGQQLMAGEQFDTRRMMATLTHVFNGHRLSFKSAFNLNQRQRRSAGSWLATAGYTAIEVEGEGGAAAPDNTSSLSLLNTQDELISSIRSAAFVLRPGYAYHWVYRNFFLHTSATAGMALQYKMYSRGEAELSRWGIAPSYNLRGSLGYDNGRYFATLLGVFYRTSLQAEELRLRETAYNMQLMVGYRFAEPKWLRNAKPGILEKFQ